MPNKKTKTVKIRHLECFSAIYGELAQKPEYAGYEIEEAVLQVKSYIPPTVKDVDKAIEKIRFSHATRKYKYPVFEGRELIDQKTLAKMAGVSRQTVARWEELGFISSSNIGLSQKTGGGRSWGGGKICLWGTSFPPFFIPLQSCRMSCIVPSCPVCVK